MGSILGSKPTTSSSTSAGAGTSNSSSASTARSNSNSSSSNYARTTPGFTSELGKVLASSLNGTSGFSKTDAVNDVQGLLRQQATDALQTVMPSIAKQDRQSGVYNSTTTDLLQNDANARITAQLAGTLTDTISKYAAADSARIGAFSDATRAATASESGGSSVSNSTSSQDSASNSSSEYQQGASSGSRGGGSGLLGLFADGGEVPEDNSALMQFLKQTGITEAPKSVSDMMSKKISESSEIKDIKDIMSIASFMGFEHGGQVPGDEEEEEEKEGITININTGGPSKKGTKTSEPSQVMDLIKQQMGFADGTSAGVRTGQSDVEAGGKIRGPETKDGKDNQIIAVGGGEGILPKDVMEVPGVPELVQHLIQKYHTPVKQ